MCVCVWLCVCMCACVRACLCVCVCVCVEALQHQVAVELFGMQICEGVSSFCPQICEYLYDTQMCGNYTAHEDVYDIGMWMCVIICICRYVGNCTTCRCVVIIWYIKIYMAGMSTCVIIYSLMRFSSLLHFSNLKTQLIIHFSTSLLPRSVEKKPISLRLENESLNDTPNTIGCSMQISGCV